MSETTMPVVSIVGTGIETPSAGRDALRTSEGIAGRRMVANHDTTTAKARKCTSTNWP